MKAVFLLPDLIYCHIKEVVLLLCIAVSRIVVVGANKKFSPLKPAVHPHINTFTENSITQWVEIYCMQVPLPLSDQLL
jgi:hypothetical protein